MSTLRANPKFEALAKELISHILGFQEGEENFVRSQQYVLSNLLYHHCLDVNSHAVKRSIEGVAFKFSVHGHINISQRLLDLTDTFLSSSYFQDKGDLKWSLLSLLLHLSQRPTEGADQPQLLHLVASEEDLHHSSSSLSTSQWQKILQEDQPSYTLGPEEPLSDWSISSSDDEVGSTATITHKSDVKIDSRTISNRQTKSLLSLSHLARCRLSQQLQPIYWSATRNDGFLQSATPGTSHKAGVIPSIIRSKKKSITVKEWAVVREAIWLLLRPASGYVFSRDRSGYLRLSAGISISSLSTACLSSLLKQIVNGSTQLEDVDAWMSQSESAHENLLPAALRSYAAGLHQWRLSINKQLTKLEEQVRSQEDCDTLLWLLQQLPPLLKIISVVHSVHVSALARHDRDQHTPSFRLISVLVSNVESATESTERSTLLRLLLHTLRYYFQLINTWLNHASMPHKSLQFILYRDPKILLEDQMFWFRAFTDIVPGKKLSISDDLNLPGLDFLKCVRGPLAEVGQAQELLSALKPSISKTTKNICSKVDVEAEIISQFCLLVGKKDLEKLNGAESTEESKKNNSNDDRECVLMNNLSLDPFLQEAFSLSSQMDNPSSQNVDKITQLIEGLDAVYHVGVERVLCNVLLPIVHQQQESVSRDVVKMLLNNHHLGTHLHAVRAVLLLEAGDVMHEFFTYLFTKVENHELLEEVGLTQHLQYCVGKIFPTLASNFIVSIHSQSDGTDQLLPTPNEREESLQDALPGHSSVFHHPLRLPQENIISVINIQYKSVWPLTLVLRDTVMMQYNRLFQFCLSLKRAICLLQRLHFKELASFESRSEEIRERISNFAALYSDHQTTESCDHEEETTSLAQRQHRLQLLRQWLMYFSNVVHDHFITSIFMPFHYGMDKLIQSKPNLGTLLSDHEQRLDELCKECLLTEDNKQSPVQATLYKVFSVVEEVGRLWVGPSSAIKISRLTQLEEEYARCHRFLVNLLVTLTTAHYWPNLEALLHALLNSCPLKV